MADIWIAGTKVARPASVKVGRFDLTKSSRCASGKMNMEIIRAGVRRVDVTWSYLADADMQTILNILAANKPFFQLKYPDVGGDKTMTCYVGDIIHGLWHTVGGVKRWKDVQTSFIEQ
jgi:hypothetical protein